MCRSVRSVSGFSRSALCRHSGRHPGLDPGPESSALDRFQGGGSGVVSPVSPIGRHPGLGPGPAPGGSQYHMGGALLQTKDGRTRPAVSAYPSVMIAMAVLLARYGQSILSHQFLPIFNNFSHLFRPRHPAGTPSFRPNPVIPAQPRHSGPTPSFRPNPVIPAQPRHSGPTPSFRPNPVICMLRGSRRLASLCGRPGGAVRHWASRYRKGSGCAAPE